MICACLLGLPAIMLVLMSMYCIRLPNDTSAVKMKRARVGGVLFILMCKQKNTQQFEGQVYRADVSRWIFTLSITWSPAFLLLCLLQPCVASSPPCGFPSAPTRMRVWCHLGIRSTPAGLVPASASSVGSWSCVAPALTPGCRAVRTVSTTPEIEERLHHWTRPPTTPRVPGCEMWTLNYRFKIHTARAFIIPVK